MDILKKLSKFSHAHKLFFLIFVALVIYCVFFDNCFGLRENFDSKDPHFVMFYAPWCGYCKKAMPDWDSMGDSYSGVKIAKVNCDENPDVAKKHGVKSYPTIKFLPNGLDDPSGSKEYDEERTKANFLKFISRTVQGDPDRLPNQAAEISPDNPPYRQGMGPLTTSFVARNVGMA